MHVPNRIIAHTFALVRQTKVSPVYVPMRCKCRRMEIVFVPDRLRLLQTKLVRKRRIHAVQDFTLVPINYVCRCCSGVTVKTIAVTIPTSQDVQHQNNLVHVRSNLIFCFVQRIVEFISSYKRLQHFSFCFLAHMFSCVSDGKCIPDYFLCDHDRDCSDGSDEADCKFDACKSTEFKCNNGRCINRKWLCGMYLSILMLIFLSQ